MAYTQQSTNVSAGDQAQADQYNKLVSDIHDLATAIFGDDTSNVFDDTQIKADTISERTLGNGVNIDGVLLKDNDVEATTGRFSNRIYSNTISEFTAGNGVNIDGVLLKDNDVVGVDVTASNRLIAGTDVQINTVNLSEVSGRLRLNHGLDLNGHDVRGLNKSIDFRAGKVGYDGGIPLPSGFSSSECYWMSSIQDSSAGSNTWSICGVRVLGGEGSGGADRSPAPQVLRYNSGWHGNGYSNYVIIGIKNRV